MKLPVRRDQLRHNLQAFTAWLNGIGAEVCKPTNPYEVLRYRAYWKASRKAVVHIIYAKDNGLLTWTGASMEHFRLFMEGASVEPQPVAAPAFVPVVDDEPTNLTARRRKRLLERDGSDCWFCGRPMLGDITLEHLVPQSRGGGNDPANCVLAHAKCNQKAANLSISEKVQLRAALLKAEGVTRHGE